MLPRQQAGGLRRGLPGRWVTHLELSHLEESPRPELGPDTELSAYPSHI